MMGGLRCIKTPLPSFSPHLLRVDVAPLHRQLRVGRVALGRERERRGALHHGDGRRLKSYLYLYIYGHANQSVKRGKWWDVYPQTYKTRHDQTEERTQTWTLKASRVVRCIPRLLLADTARFRKFSPRCRSASRPSRTARRLAASAAAVPPSVACAMLWSMQALSWTTWSLWCSVVVVEGAGAEATTMSGGKLKPMMETCTPYSVSCGGGWGNDWDGGQQRALALWGVRWCGWGMGEGRGRPAGLNAGVLVRKR